GSGEKQFKANKQKRPLERVKRIHTLVRIVLKKYAFEAVTGEAVSSWRFPIIPQVPVSEPVLRVS
ncbi:hypothetical protein, partial [uncultured Roseobacter sp.]|uniref:hypothetical protein n=1 Tax=uncultured Roseobacter sp. TaxID=114847 RepID=UPI002621E2BE